MYGVFFLVFGIMHCIGVCFTQNECAMKIIIGYKIYYTTHFDYGDFISYTKVPMSHVTAKQKLGHSEFFSEIGALCVFLFVMITATPFVLETLNFTQDTSKVHTYVHGFLCPCGIYVQSGRHICGIFSNVC